MARWRPPALVVDSLLAIALALVSLGTVETGQSVQESPAPQVHWTVSPPPADGQTGDVWDARIVVFRDGAPAAAPGEAPPSVELRSGTTWTTTTATPDGAPGFYRARVVLHGDAPYAYAVLVDNPGEPPAPAEGIPFWVVILTLLATLPVALRRRFPLPVLAVTLAAALGAAYVNDAFVFPGALVALYTVAAYVGRPRSLYAAAVTAAVLVLHVLAIDSLGFWELLGELRPVRRRLAAGRQRAHPARAGAPGRGRAAGQRAAGGGRGAGADRPRAARRHRPQRERDDHPGRGRRRRVRQPARRGP